MAHLSTDEELVLKRLRADVAEVLAEKSGRSGPAPEAATGFPVGMSDDGDLFPAGLAASTTTARDHERTRPRRKH